MRLPRPCARTNGQSPTTPPTHHLHVLLLAHCQSTATAAALAYSTLHGAPSANSPSCPRPRRCCCCAAPHRVYNLSTLTAAHVPSRLGAPTDSVAKHLSSTRSRINRPNYPTWSCVVAPSQTLPNTPRPPLSYDQRALLCHSLALLARNCFLSK